MHNDVCMWLVFYFILSLFFKSVESTAKEKSSCLAIDQECQDIHLE